MTLKQYLEAMKAGKPIDKNHPVYWGNDVNDDYVCNSDIPLISESTNETFIEIVNYYYFWFPLVKDSIQEGGK